MGVSPTKRDFEQWRKEELEQPNLRPELSFVAWQGDASDPLTGPLVGYTLTGQVKLDEFYIDMTGVKRSLRGQGLGRALKLAAMQAMREAGGKQLKTYNDPDNAPMLALNRSLGFQQTCEYLRYELPLD